MSIEQEQEGAEKKPLENKSKKAKGRGFFSELPLKELGWSWLQAAGLVVFCVVVALLTNWIRGPKHGGLPLKRRRPFDLFTDCPEILDNIPSISVKKLPRSTKKAKGLLYIDARKGLAHCKGHIPGSLFLPMYETDPPDPKIVSWLKSLKGRWFVIYGDATVSSAKRLATVLINEKVRGIKLLEGNLEAWKKDKRKVATCMAEEVDLANLPSKQVVFVDARSEEDFNAAHIPKALFIPYDDLLPPDPKVLAKLPKPRDRRKPRKRRKKRPQGKLIVVYDSGKPPAEGEIKDRAKGTAALLKARGYFHVKVLNGGLEAWKKEGKSLEKGSEESSENEE